MITLIRWTMHAGPMPASLTDDPGPEIERGTGEIVAPQTMTLGFVRFFDGDGKAVAQGKFSNAVAGHRVALDVAPLSTFEIVCPRPIKVGRLRDSLSVDNPWPEAFGNAQIDLGPMDIFEICAIGRLVGAESSRMTTGFSMPPPEQWDE